MRCSSALLPLSLLTSSTMYFSHVYLICSSLVKLSLSNSVRNFSFYWNCFFQNSCSILSCTTSTMRSSLLFSLSAC